MARLTLDLTDHIEKMENLVTMVNVRTEVAGDEIAEDVERKTFPFVPLKHGYLQGGYKYNRTSPAPVLRLEMSYSAIANNYFDYAEIQHEKDFHHPIKGQAHYMMKGYGRVNVNAIYSGQIRAVLG